MPDALRRVSIHCGWVADDDPITVDLALPTAITVGELIPAIIDACGADDATPTYWRLCTIGGPALNESKTLAQNDVHDGDLLLLAPEPSPEPTTRTDSVTAALAASVP
ncbi:EsaB/YukD family protein, partial [Mycolicibacterium sp.]